jgi:hypothetical protein
MVYADMTVDQKVRYGVVVLTGASFVFSALGLHGVPLAISGSAGGG